MRINGISVNTYGDKSKPCVIFLHGFPFDSRMWESTVKALSDNYYLIVPDIRGFGKSEPEEAQYTIDTYVDDLFIIQDELSIRKSVIAGFSMGGYITLRAYERNKDRFSGIMLIDTKASADTDEARIKRGLGIKNINELGIENFMKDFIPAVFTKDAPQRIKGIYDRCYTIASSQNPLGVKAALLAMAARTSTEHILNQIRVSAAIIGGREDSLTPPATMKEIHNAVKNSELHIIDNAAHMVPQENPNAFNEILMRFLSKFF